MISSVPGDLTTMTSVFSIAGPMFVSVIDRKTVGLFPGLHDDQIATVVPAPVSQMAEDTVASKSLSMHAMPALLSPSKLRCRIGRHTYPATAQKVIVIVYIGCSTHATLIQPSLSQLGCCQKWW